MNDDEISTFGLVLVRSAETNAHVYGFEAAARLTEVHPDLLNYYCRSGLLGDSYRDPEQDLVFDDDALYEVRRIEHFRKQHGVNLRALPLVCSLSRQIDRLQAEVRFLRDR